MPRCRGPERFAARSALVILVLAGCDSPSFWMPPPNGNGTGGGQSTGIAGAAGGTVDSTTGNGGTGVVAHHCSNDIKDDDETDVDCGGDACVHCVDGLACSDNDDCWNRGCVEGRCMTPSCNDSRTNWE